MPILQNVSAVRRLNEMQSEWDNADAYLMNGAVDKNKEKLTLVNAGWKSADVCHNCSRNEVAEVTRRVEIHLKICSAVQ